MRSDSCSGPFDNRQRALILLTTKEHVDIGAPKGRISRRGEQASLEAVDEMLMVAGGPTHLGERHMSLNPPRIANKLPIDLVHRRSLLALADQRSGMLEED